MAGDLADPRPIHCLTKSNAKAVVSTAVQKKERPTTSPRSVRSHTHHRHHGIDTVPSARQHASAQSGVPHLHRCTPVRKVVCHRSLTVTQAPAPIQLETIAGAALASSMLQCAAWCATPLYAGRRLDMRGRSGEEAGKRALLIVCRSTAADSVSTRCGAAHSRRDASRRCLRLEKLLKRACRGWRERKAAWRQPREPA